jgi:hypothetical protein
MSMSFCDQCGNTVLKSDTQCSKCFADLAHMRAFHVQPSADGEATAYPSIGSKLSRSATSRPYLAHALGVIVFAVGAFFVLTALGTHRAQVPAWLFLAWVAWFLGLVPAAAGSLVVAIKGATAPRWLEWFNSWLGRKANLADASRSKFTRYITWPVLWVFGSINHRAIAVHNDVLRNGARAAANVFAVCLFLFMLYLATVIIITILILALVVLIIGAFIGPSGVKITLSQSRVREGWFGDKYIETRDTDGNLTAESRQREGWFGDKYVEHQDADGNVIGESRQREGFFGDRYTEHQDADGKVTGESRQREGLFGDKYVEHQDADGNITSESRQRDGWFGDKYVEHKKRK